MIVFWWFVSNIIDGRWFSIVISDFDDCIIVGFVGVELCVCCRSELNI